MKKREDIEARTEELIKEIVSGNGFELVDVDFIKEGSDYFLRVYIDKPGGITINDCESVSREFNEILDEKDYIDVPYIFEVSSPGLTRPLKKERDFSRNTGKEIEIKLYSPHDGVSEFSGVLENYDDGKITVSLHEGDKKIFNIKDLAFIRLAYVDKKT